MTKHLSFILLLTLFSCHEKNDNFELCGMGITRPYYVTGLDYKGELYAIEKEFRQHFKSPQTNSTGIAKIKFQVNCHGESGNFNYEEYNLDYKKVDLNDSIKIQIEQITKGLDQWIPGKDDDGENVNSFKFLSFRLHDGIIIEILPK